MKTLNSFESLRREYVQKSKDLPIPSFVLLILLTFETPVSFNTGSDGKSKWSTPSKHSVNNKVTNQKINLFPIIIIGETPHNLLVPITNIPYTVLTIDYSNKTFMGLQRNRVLR